MPCSDKNPPYSSTDVADRGLVKPGSMDSWPYSEQGTFNAAVVAVLRASQALSSELQLDQLLVLLLQTMLEHGRADQGVVLMPRKQGWYVEATATAKQPAQVQSTALADSTAVPHGLIRTVKERLETVVVADATTDPTLMPEPYIQTHQPKSLLCKPLLHQGRLVAVLYLENRATTGAFTGDRLLILNFLSTQAAIALENARLYTQAQADQRRLTALMGNLPGMAYVAANDEHWTMHFASEGCFELTGYTSDELINNRVTDFGTLIHADDAEAVGLAVETAVSANRPFRVVYRIRTKQGEEKWLWEQGQAILDDHGNPTLLEGLMIDISDRKQAELALQNNEAHMRALVSALPDLIMRVSREGIYLEFSASPNFRVMGNLPDWVGTHVATHMPPEPAQQRLQAIEAALATQQVQTYEQVLSIEGVRQYEEVRVVPYAEDETLLLVRDISDRKVAEEASQNFQRRLEFLIDQTPIGIVEWNPDFKIIGWNAAAEKIFGYGAVEMLGQQGMQFIPESVRPRVAEIRTELREQRGGNFSLNENLRKDGTTIICEWINTVLRDADNNFIGVVSMVQDVSERESDKAAIAQKSQALKQTLKELQQTQLQMVQSEKMSALGGLVAGVAHEINNPVGCILGNVGATQAYISDLLGLLDLYAEQFPEPGSDIEEELDAVDLAFVREDLPQLVRAMKDSGDRIKSISQSLRTFSRADTDEKQAFNLHEGIDSTVLILRHRLKANEQRPEIEVVTNYGDIPEIACFPGQLNQVFMNILANAIDAFDEASQHCTMADLEADPQRITICTSMEASGVKIAIADNGPGISADIQGKIFEHLFTTKGVGKGTGLGLAIARQIVEDTHGGSLTLHSESGKGTKFCIRLPRH